MATNTTEHTDFDVSDGIEQIHHLDAKALTTPMATLPNQPEVSDADNMWLVQHDTEHTVAKVDGEFHCDCKGHQFGHKCYHIRRAEFATGRRTIPSWADVGAIDPSLGEHVEDGPKMSETADADGGELAVADGGQQTEARITGPHPEFDKYGNYTGSDFWRCSGCGAEAIRRSDLDYCCEGKR